MERKSGSGEEEKVVISVSFGWSEGSVVNLDIPTPCCGQCSLGRILGRD
jgi:hypothetical protein